MGYQPIPKRHTKYGAVMLNLFQHLTEIPKQVRDDTSGAQKVYAASDRKSVSNRNAIYLILPLALSGCAAPLVGGIGAIGMSAVEDRGISGVASDQTLRVRLNVELSDGLADFSNIELTVYKGRVLFTGVAASPQIKAQAVRIAQNVSGVKQVLDHMHVSGEDGFAEYTRDSWMTTKLKAALYSDEDIIAPNYVIKTFDKTIYIFGTGQTTDEINKVVEHAFDITGVKKVVNLMEVVQ